MTAGPFPGLVPYGDEHAEYFFGRQSARRTVLDNLMAYRMTILYGQSGVGKSSLLHAGVVHELRAAQRRCAAEGRPPDYGIVAVRTWTGDPLAAVLHEIGASRPGDSLATALDRASDALGAPLLVVLDQFEEYCLYHPDDDEAEDSFDAQLARVVSGRGTAANFMISIREDALSRLDRYDGRIPGFLDNLLRLDHLDRESASEATERPLALWRERGGEGPGDAEPELIGTLLDQVEEGTLQVGEAEGALHDGRRRRVRTPYLQLVLARLWDEEARAGSRVLRLRTLERLGGAERIVATHLDAAMDKLAPRERAVAAALFRQLVTPSGAKIAQRAGDLAAYAELPEAEVTPVLERLTRESRILQALDGSRYEIYHDALAPPILEWQRRWELRRARRLGRRRVLAMLVLAASWLVLLAFAAPNLELSSVDLRFRALGSRPDPRVVVVGIDDKTFGALRAQWPFDRRLHARVISRLRRAGARVIAYDVQFIEPSSNAAADNALLEAVRRSARAGTPVVLATSEAVAGRTKVFGGSAGLAYSHGVPAYSGQVEDRDGAIRHMRRRAYGLETLPVVTAGLARGRPIAAAQLPGRRAWIDFRGAGAYRTVSFADVVRGRVPRRMLRGKIVVVGGTAPALQDVNRVATSDAMAGPEVAANEISTALDGFPLHDPPRLTGAILTLAFGVAVLVAALRFPLPRVAVLAAAIAVLYGVVAWFAFPAGVVLPVVYPLAALVFATIAMLFVGGLVVRGR